VVARQLGTRGRRWDTVVLECDREALSRRAALGPERLDSDLLGVVRGAPAEWAWYRDALPEPDYPWRHVREAVHRAADRGLVETREGDRGRIELRRRYRYPPWVERVIAIENKPDLDAAAARDLTDQLERDVALGLADEVWVATRATGEPVEPALLEPLPVEAGVLAVDVPASGGNNPGVDTAPGAGRSTARVVWHAGALAVGAPGTRIVERPAGGARDASAARFEYAAPDWKAAKRREIAERAYERGWRSYHEAMRPDCRGFRLRDPDVPLPHCTRKGRRVTARECSGSCPAFAPEPPAWRTKEWPIEGGPGAAVRRVLDDQRERRR